MKTLVLFNKYSYNSMETLNTVLPPIVLYKLFALWIKY